MLRDTDSKEKKLAGWPLALACIALLVVMTPIAFMFYRVWQAGPQ